MDIDVSGKGVDVGEALTTHVQSRLQEVVEKYLDKANGIKVVFGKDSGKFSCHIHANLTTNNNMMVRSQSENHDIYAAFDAALEKVDKQLRRYKRKIKDHHAVSMGGAEIDIAGEARKYVLPSDVGEHEGEETLSGAIIAEKPTAIDTLTVSQAVMKMDLQELPAVMFRNVSSGRINVVYRRADGNISWVDPSEEAVEKAA